jgi:hypothetical protein
MWDSQGFAQDILEMEQTKYQTKGTNKMSFLQIGEQLNQFKEETPVPGGEYQLRITSAQIPEGKDYLLTRFEIVGEPYAKEVSDFFRLPGGGRDDKEENRNRGKLLKFFNAFDIDPAGNYQVDQQEPDGFVGREGYAILTDPVDKNDQYGPQNKISRYSPRG